MPALELFWAGLPKGVRDGILLAVLLIGAFFLGKAFVDAWKAEAVRRAREKDTAKTIEVVHEIQEEARHDADAAIEARNHAPQPGSAERVPDEVADRIFSDREGRPRPAH